MTLLPHEYVPILRGLGVTCVVRFNSKCYDRKVFVNSGIRHEDLLYEDGGNPSEAILQAFLRICESERGVVAVHCKAGLGRTGTNIAAYMMKHLGFSAREAIAWCRFCRPGSIVGPQQQFLVSIEAAMREQGSRSAPVESEESDKVALRFKKAAVSSIGGVSAALPKITSKICTHSTPNNVILFLETAVRSNDSGYIAARIALAKHRQSSPPRRSSGSQSSVSETIKDNRGIAQTTAVTARKEVPGPRPVSSFASLRNGENKNLHFRNS